ncbi:MAG: alpha/beta hydrolase [Enterococcus sp.]
MRKIPQPIYSQNGQRAILLLHAYSGSSNDVRMLARFLERQGYTVYAPVLSGHGTNEPQDIFATGPSNWWQEVKEGIGFLQAEGYSQMAVFGLSMGGVLAAKALTKNFPEVIGGGLFCAPIFKTDNQVPENFLAYAELIYQQNQLPETLMAAKLSEVKVGVQQQLATIEQFALIVANELKKIKVPVFVAQGGKDTMIDENTVFQTVKELKNTTFALKWYPESGHVITVAPNHQQFEKDVFDFIETLNWNEDEG